MQPAVTFDGLSKRNGPLSWGQRWAYDIIAELAPEEHRLNFRITFPVPPGRSLADLLSAVETMVARHETLRTRYCPDDEDRLCQVVDGSGRVPVQVVAAGAETAETADALEATLGARRFDLAAELPLRIAVVTCRDQPAFLVVILSYIALDAWGGDVFFRELTARIDAGPGPVAGAPPEPHPVDQAAAECSERGRRAARAGFTYWQEQFADIAALPARLHRRPGEQPRYWCARFSSVALATATREVARRHGVAPSAVILAAMSAIVAHQLGQRALPVFLVASNRYLPSIQSALGRYSQSSPLVVPLDAATFDDLVGETATRILRASRFAHFDPMEVSPLVHGAGPHRPAHLALPIVYDFHHQPALETPDAPFDPRQVRRSAVRSAFGWLNTLDDENMHLYFQVHRFDGEAGILVWTDTRFLSRAEVAAALFGIERLLVEAAAGQIDLKELPDITGI